MISFRTYITTLLCIVGISISVGAPIGMAQTRPSDRHIELQSKRMLIRGLTFLQTGYPDKAAAVFAEALKVNPEQATLLAAMSKAQQQLNDTGLAGFYLEGALSLEPSNPAFQEQGIQYYVYAGRVDKAIELASIRVRNEPDNERYSYELLMLLKDAQQWPKALEEIDRFQHDRGLSVSYLRLRSEVYYATGDLENALNATQELLELTAMEEDHMQVARILTQLGQRDDALEAISDLLDKAPSYAPALTLLNELAPSAAMDKESGMSQDSGSTDNSSLLAELRANPDNEDAARSAAESLLSTGTIPDAELALQVALAQIEYDPRQLSMWIVGIQAHVVTGHPEAGIQLADDALLLFPGYVPVLVELAAALVAHNEKARAETVIRDVLSRSGVEEDLRQRLGDLLRQIEPNQ